MHASSEARNRALTGTSPCESGACVAWIRSLPVFSCEAALSAAPFRLPTQHFSQRRNKDDLQLRRTRGTAMLAVQPRLAWRLAPPATPGFPLLTNPATPALFRAPRARTRPNVRLPKLPVRELGALRVTVIDKEFRVSMAQHPRYASPKPALPITCATCPERS